MEQYQSNSHTTTFKYSLIARVWIHYVSTTASVRVRFINSIRELSDGNKRTLVLVYAASYIEAATIYIDL